MTRECTSQGVRWNVVDAGPIESSAGTRWRFTFTPMTGRGEEVLRTADRSLDEFHEGELRALLEMPPDLP